MKTNLISNNMPFVLQSNLIAMAGAMMRAWVGLARTLARTCAGSGFRLRSCDSKSRKYKLHASKGGYYLMPQIHLRIHNHSCKTKRRMCVRVAG